MSLTPASHRLEIAALSSSFLGTPIASSAVGANFAPAGGAVLLVEDNDSLREMTEMLLTVMGYRVIACGNAQIASHAFFTGHLAGTINLLLTDIEMPGRSGLELAHELTAAQPSLPVLIVSGSVLSSDLSRELEVRNWKFVSKPFRLPMLVDTLQALLPVPRETSA